MYENPKVSPIYAWKKLSFFLEFANSCLPVKNDPFFAKVGTSVVYVLNREWWWWWWWWVSDAIWASYQIRKIAGAHAPGKFSPPPRVNDPGMHHGTCVTHVPWCMPGSLTNDFLWSRRRGKTFPAFPAHAQTAILRIWQEAHTEAHWWVITIHGFTWL